jgi:rhodanese-related sulfurtransferase
MKNPLSRLTLNQQLGLLLFALGLGALLIGNPSSGAIVTIDAAELGRIVQTEVDHVAPDILADWIIQGKPDYRLIDLRSEKEYADYHIPGAENVPPALLANHGLLRNEKIVLYSEGGIHSAQAWFLLKAMGYRGVYMLRGGLEEWKSSVLFPEPPLSPSPAQAATFEKRKEVSRFFGGTPATGSASAEAAVVPQMPKLMPGPAGAGPAPGSIRAKKKKEGC